MRAPIAFLLCMAAALPAQEHAYRPHEAHLEHATERWLAWRPDDKGASILTPEKGGAEESEIEGLPEKKEEDPDGLRPAEPLELPKMPVLGRKVFVLQEAGKPRAVKLLELIPSKDGPEIPVGLRVVTIRPDGTLVLCGYERDYLFLLKAGEKVQRHVCLAKRKVGTLVAAYPDGVVVQTPSVPFGARSRPKSEYATLYWVPFGDFGLDHAKAQKMTFGKGVLTAYRLSVARFGDDVAMPGGVYSLRRKKRKRFTSELQEGIHAFDGRVAIGRGFTFATRKKDRRSIKDRRTYILVRDDVGYWLEEGNRGLWILNASPMQAQDKVKELGWLPFRGDFLFARDIEASTLALTDSRTKTRITVYWNKNGIHWTDEHKWKSHAWLGVKDFG